MANITEMLSRARTGEMYQPFVRRITEVITLLAQDGVVFYATCGLRTVAQQDLLYAQGRTAPGKIVTKARGGYSYHNYGIAIDFARDKDPAPGLQPDWSPSSLKKLADAAMRAGLESGYYWKTMPDGPHVQLRISQHGIKLEALRKVHNQAGLAGVYAFLDQYEW